MTGGATSEFVGLLDRRGELLAAIGEEPTEKHELEERLDVSRSTIDRGVRELEDGSLLERSGGGFVRTLPGRIALDEYERFAERVEGLGEATDLLAVVDAEADLGVALLAGARVVESTRASPGRPLDALYEVVEAAERVRGFGPAIHSRQVDVYSRRILEEGMSAEFVLTDEAVEQLLANYGDVLERALDSDRVDLFRTDAEMHYSVTLAETPDGDRVGVLVYDDAGITGCILNDREAAVDWAERRFEAVRGDAEALD